MLGIILRQHGRGRDGQGNQQQNNSVGSAPPVTRCPQEPSPLCAFAAFSTNIIANSCLLYLSLPTRSMHAFSFRCTSLQPRCRTSADLHGMSAGPPAGWFLYAIFSGRSYRIVAVRFLNEPPHFSFRCLLLASLSGMLCARRPETRRGVNAAGAPAFGYSISKGSGLPVEGNVFLYRKESRDCPGNLYGDMDIGLSMAPRDNRQRYSPRRIWDRKQDLATRQLHRLSRSRHKAPRPHERFSASVPDV